MTTFEHVMLLWSIMYPIRPINDPWSRCSSFSLTRFEVVLLNAMFNRVSVLLLTLLVKTLVKLKRSGHHFPKKDSSLQVWLLVCLHLLLGTLVKPFSASSMSLQVPSNKSLLGFNVLCILHFFFPFPFSFNMKDQWKAV